MIKLEHLNKTFHLKDSDVEAVKDVSLEVADGEIFGVIGYSGAGKSTLVRCINLLERPDSGNVTVDGKQLVKTEKNSEGKDVTTFISERELNKVRKGIGMIFQHFNLLERSTVYDNIAYPLKYTGMSRGEIHDRVLELLELVDLEDKINVYPSQLSGGQKQRVAIARAIAGRPKVLLSDEATSALDPDATESILELLKKLNTQLGLTIVLITHEMSVIKSICNHIAVMETGRIVEEGNTYDIFADPKQPITKKFVNAATAIDNPGTIEEEANGLPVRLVFAKDSVGDAVISQISRKYNVDVNIMLANVERLQEGPLGKMVVGLKGNEEDVRDAIAYLKANKITVEVLHDAVD